MQRCSRAAARRSPTGNDIRWDPGPRVVPDEGESLPGAPRLGRSLLNSVTDADWIIDASISDLLHRQRLLEQVEGVARMAAVVTCSAPGLSPTELCARLRRPGRLLVARGFDPVEHIPAVEVVPGSRSRIEPASTSSAAGSASWEGFR